MKNISAIEDIVNACDNLDKIVIADCDYDSTRLAIARTYLTIALDKLHELELKIRNL